MYGMTTIDEADERAARDLRFLILAAVRPTGFSATDQDAIAGEATAAADGRGGVRLSWRRLRELMPDDPADVVGAAGVQVCVCVLASLLQGRPLLEVMDRPPEIAMTEWHVFGSDDAGGYWAFLITSAEFEAMDWVVGEDVDIVLLDLARPAARA